MGTEGMCPPASALGTTWGMMVERGVITTFSMSTLTQPSVQTCPVSLGRGHLILYGEKSQSFLGGGGGRATLLFRVREEI